MRVYIWIEIHPLGDTREAMTEVGEFVDEGARLLCCDGLAECVAECRCDERAVGVVTAAVTLGGVEPPAGEALARDARFAELSAVFHC